MIFRRTDKYGYSRYYGGGGPAFVIKVVATILVMVALVIGAAAFVVQKYMVYTENGGHLELPWTKKSSQVTPEDPGGGGLDDLVVVDNQEAEASVSAERSTDAGASESAEVSVGAESSQSAEVSAEGSQSAASSQSAEASTEGTQSAEASQSAAASSGAEASPGGESSAPAQPAQPGLWARFISWLSGLFQAPQPVTPADASAAPAPAPEASSPAQTEQVEQPETASESQGAESASQSQQEEQAPPASAREALSGGLLIQHVSIGDVKAGYAEGDVKNKKGNGIMLFMKESGGKLNFSSGQELAKELEVDGEESTGKKIKEVVSELKGKDYYTLAYVNCFQDQKAGGESDLRLYDQDKDAWIDGEDRAWANPASSRYQNYLVALIRELDEMGFDEIVLGNACYPATGKTSNLSKECYDPDTFQATVTDFYEKLAKELKDCKCMVSLVTTKKAIQDGYDEATGQSLEGMLQLGGRLWVDTYRDDAEKLSEALKAAGYPDNALGMLVGSLKESDAFNQMNVD